MLLATHPSVYGALLDELSGTLRGAAPTAEQLSQLPLLDQVVKESQRLLPASCILFFRAAQEPFSLHPHSLPAGARLLTSPLIVHRDPAVYTDPLRFVPARWSALTPSAYEYMPFGAGPRLCIGAQFAAQAIRTALAVMLQRFRFELAPNARVDRLVRGITLGARDGIRMRLSPPGAPTAPPLLRGDIHELVKGMPRG